MTQIVNEVRYAPPVAAMKAFVVPFQGWMEKLLGCDATGMLIFDLEIPFGQVVIEDLLHGVVLDRQCLAFGQSIRPEVVRWELPPGFSPRIQLIMSREQTSPITSKERAWDPHWLETPVAVWLKNLRHPLIAIAIPYVSFEEGSRHKWKSWLFANRTEVAPALNMLRVLLAEKPKEINVLGGRNITLAPGGFNWDSIVMDAMVSKLVRDDFNFFFKREDWFKQLHLPFRRGYLFYGPPGNGKTSAVRVMASHPNVTAFTLDFSNEELHNDALTALFDDAAQAAPSLVIFEDLDHLYGKAPDDQNRTRITRQHLLNCLDGLGSKDGTIVVATANNPAELDPAILRRPGRFDRIVPFHLPNGDLRKEYLKRLAGSIANEEELQGLARLANNLSFAQIREVYILAGQAAFHRGTDLPLVDDLVDGIRMINRENGGVGSRSATGSMGFAAAASEEIQ